VRVVGQEKAVTQAVDFLSYTSAGTQSLAEFVAKIAFWGRFIGLYGELGVGKTEFVRGLARGLDAREEVSSPTYVLENVYSVSGGLGEEYRTIHHWDFYRVSDTYDEGDLLDYQGVQSKLVVIEWPERVPWVDQMVHTKIVFTYESEASEHSQAGADNYPDAAIRRISIAGITTEQKAALEQFSAEGLEVAI
jgi:tRNA threonylcarbamoyladenosine biosynthesis protein TsaE